MERSKVIDSAKGVCMILIIAGHSSYISHTVENFITLFHVPVFFFVSAYLFKYSDDLFKYVSHKAKTLLLPLLYVVLITSGITFFKSAIKGHFVDGGREFLISLVGGYCNGMEQFLKVKNGLWRAYSLH